MQKGAHTALLLAAQASSGCGETVQQLVAGGASVNAVGETGDTVVKLLVAAGEIEAAAHCVRHGAGFEGLTLEAVVRSRFGELYATWEEAERRRIAVEESLAAEGGAQAAAAAANCMLSGPLLVKGTARWNNRFLVLGKTEGGEVARGSLRQTGAWPCVCAEPPPPLPPHSGWLGATMRSGVRWLADSRAGRRSRSSGSRRTWR